MAFPQTKSPSSTLPFTTEFYHRLPGRRHLLTWKLAAVLALQIIFGAGRALAQRPLGIDVSDYQGSSINWATVKSDGISFAWTKSTEGAAGQYINQNSFTINENAGKAAGVYMGAYHYAHCEQNAPGLEVSYFWSVAGTYIKADGLTLMPMLDVESTAFSGHIGATSVSDWVNQWCNAVAADGASQGVIKPVIYVSACNTHYFDTSVAQWFSGIADYSGLAAQSGSPWTTSACTPVQQWGSGVWHFWQYTSSSTYPGISGNVDHDVYNGTLTNLVANLILGGTPPTITVNPVTTTVWVGSNVTFTAGAGSVVTASYTWKFNGTNISGATTTSYTITNAQLTNAGSYTFRATNIYGSTNSTPAFLGVLGPLTNAPASVVAPTGLVNWWPADGNAYDIFSTDNGIPGGGFSYAQGEIGRAFHFNGTSSSLTLATNISLPVPWTVTMWVNRESTAQTSAALMSDGTNSIKLEQNPNTHQLGVTQLGVDNVFSPTYTVPTGTWTHLAFVGTSTGTTVYVNGVQKGTVTNSFRLPGQYFGATWSPSNSKFVDFMQGSMDEIMLFNRALSGTEISAISAAGTAGVVKAPQFMGTSLVNGKQFVLTMRGETGKNYNLEYSADMTAWFSVGNSISNATGTTTFTDPNAYRIAKRFFRISQSY